MDSKEFKKLAPMKGVMLFVDVEKKDEEGGIMMMGSLCDISLEHLGMSFVGLLKNEPIDNQILLFEMIVKFLKKKQAVEDGRN